MKVNFVLLWCNTITYNSLFICQTYTYIDIKYLLGMCYAKYIIINSYEVVSKLYQRLSFATEILWF